MIQRTSARRTRFPYPQAIVKVTGVPTPNPAADAAPKHKAEHKPTEAEVVKTIQVRGRVRAAAATKCRAGRCIEVPKQSLGELEAEDDDERRTVNTDARRPGRDILDAPDDALTARG